MKIQDIPQSGKLGKVIASRNRFGQYHTPAVPHKMGRTPAQAEARNSLGRYSRLWNTLTDEQLAGWRRLAEQVWSRSRAGEDGKLDGQKLFNKLNTVLARYGRDSLLEAPPRGQFQPNPVFGFRVVNGDNGFEFMLRVRGTPSEDIMVFASPPCKPGRAYCDIFSFIGLLPASGGAERDMSRQYLSKLKEWRRLMDKRFHEHLEGSRVFVCAIQQVNGWKNELGMFQSNARVPVTPRAAAGQHRRPKSLKNPCAQEEHKRSTTGT